jgi:hypothetical protein
VVLYVGATTFRSNSSAAGPNKDMGLLVCLDVRGSLPSRWVASSCDVRLGGERW